MNQTTQAPAARANGLLAAHTLLGRMLGAASRAGDVGRVFIVGGVRRLVSIEITFRRSASAEASAIGNEVSAAEQLVDASLANDGVIDAAEATQIRAALRKPQREARHLASELAVPEVKS